MCGILVAFGENAYDFVKNNIKKLNHRGPDGNSIYKEENLAIGFSRLAINDLSINGMQPIEVNDYISAINGEVYNHKELKNKYNYKYTSKSDTAIIPFLWNDFKENLIDELDGFYSGVVWDKNQKTLYTLRDYIGKKPLFIVNIENLLIITSELKILGNLPNFRVIPKGVTQIDFDTNNIKIVNIHKTTYIKVPTDAIEKQLKNDLIDAVHKRIPADNQKYGVFLSGGLDSSIIASIVARNKINKNVKYYILGNPQNSSDAIYAQEVIDYLKIKEYQFINIPQQEYKIKSIIENVVYSTESYNPSIISNGIGTFILSDIAHKDGIKVILSGEGADEMFFGYHKLNKESNWREIQKQLLEDMCFTELRRIDLTAMTNSIEIRCPFLDKKIYELIQKLEYEDFFELSNNDIINKKILRNIFNGYIPDSIKNRVKTSFDVGTGLRKSVVEYLRKNGTTEKEHLKKIWTNIFPNFLNNNEKYFQSYPAFDDVINKRGTAHQ